MSGIGDIERELRENGVFISTTSGVSMKPMLRDHRDTIVIEPFQGRLKKYDVALYRRGDAYVLHRVIKVLPDSYIIRGDNCAARERGIKDGDILGKLTEFYRADKKINMNSIAYRCYSRAICFLNPIVRLKLRASSLLGRISRGKKRNQWKT